MSDGRIGRFVRAARSLLMVQLAAGVVALALSVWAVVAVRDLAIERDRLQSRVAELERQAPLQPGVTPAVPTEAEPQPHVGLYAIPIPVPVAPQALPEATTPTTPTAPTTEPNNPPAGTDQPQQTGPDCTGASAATPRCRPTPGRWTRPAIPQRPLNQVVPTPQGNQQQPQIR